jgi:hypothetical protein
MADTQWQVSGEYFETCSCDYVCPCITSNLAAQPSKGSCTAALAFRIERGRYDAVTLDGLSFVVLLRTPGVMVQGNWSVGLIVDERANQEQQQAIAGIASGQAGGPMAGLGPLVGTFLGMEARPIRFQKGADGMSWSLEVPGLVDQAAQGVPSPTKPGEALAIDNTLHPANARLALATATRSHLHAFGLDWDDDSGRNNGHFAPFSWQSA